MLILAASNGHNLRLAHQVARMASERGHHSVVVDLIALDLPLYTPASEAAGGGSGLAGLMEPLRQQRRLWICAPEYNGSSPPSLTSAIAWLSRSSADFRALFQGMPVALSSHSGGGGQKALIALRIQFAHLGCHVLGRELLCSPQKAANPDSIAAMLGELHRLPPAAG
jgi:chromate reductase, NAD(P)H dehydrogenase (quinone)